MSAPVIAHILPWANIAGTEIATLRLAQIAASLGYRNLLYVPEGPATANFEAFAASYGFRTVRYRQIAPERRNPWPYVRNTFQLAASFVRNKVSVVHCSEIMAAYFAAWAGRIAGAGVISHVRCDQPPQGRLEQMLLHPVQRFVFVSHNTLMRGAVPCSPPRAQVVYEGVPLSCPSSTMQAARSHYGLPSDAFVVGMAARFSPRKDHETLVRAAAILAQRHSDIHFLLVGDHAAPHAQDLVAQLKAAMRLSGTRRFFHFAGLETRMERFYAAIDLKVLATHFEGMPLVLMEAMAAGKPVVASRVSGIPEVVVDGRTGLLVPPREPQALAEAIAAFALSPDAARNFGHAGRIHVETTFSEEAHRAQIESLYGGMLRRPLTRPSVPARDHSPPCARSEVASGRES